MHYSLLITNHKRQSPKVHETERQKERENVMGSQEALTTTKASDHL
jgi:hypothetical protein